MSYGSVGGPGGADTSSFLRFGLTNLKPIRVRETVKRWGLKFERVFTTFQPVDVPTSYSDYALLKVQGIFSSIAIPNYFEKEKLIEYYLDRKMTIYKNDKEFVEQVEILKKSRGSIAPLMDFIIYCKNRYQKEIQGIYNANVNNFYSSNIPFSVFNDFTRSENVYALFLNLLYDILYSYNLRLGLRAKSDSKYFDKVFGSMKTDISEVLDIIDKLNFQVSCLRRLLIVWNAKTYQDLDDIAFLHFENIPKDEFNRLYQSLKTDITTTRRNIILHKKYREDDFVDIKIPKSTFNTNEFIKEIFIE